jgi:hypothetical protein
METKVTMPQGYDRTSQEAGLSSGVLNISDIAAMHLGLLPCNLQRAACTAEVLVEAYNSQMNIKLCDSAKRILLDVPDQGEKNANHFFHKASGL